MSTTIEFKKMRAHYESVINVCDKRIEFLSYPEKYGCCLCRCNSIVINKERMMTVTTKNNVTTYEFCPTYPTYFSPEAAHEIVNYDVYKDCNGNRIKLEIVGELEYYKLLKEFSEGYIKLLNSLNL